MTEKNGIWKCNFTFLQLFLDDSNSFALQYVLTILELNCVNGLEIKRDN